MRSWGSLSASRKTCLLEMWMQLASSLSQMNFSSNMNNEVKYMYSLGWSVIFCDKKRKLCKDFFFFLILSLKANEYSHICTDTRKSRDEFKYCTLKIIGCEFLMCILPFTPLKFGSWKYDYKCNSKKISI